MESYTLMRPILLHTILIYSFDSGVIEQVLKAGEISVMLRVRPQAAGDQGQSERSMYEVAPEITNE